LKPAFAEALNYSSIIGKLTFLALNSRPDIAFAVHQCARWCSNPRVTHGAAVKRIGRYLKTTPTDGLIFRPNGYFAGIWNKEYANQRSTALRRTGFIIT